MICCCQWENIMGRLEERNGKGEDIPGAVIVALKIPLSCRERFLQMPVSCAEYQPDGKDPIGPSAIAINSSDQVFLPKSLKLADYPVPKALNLNEIQEVVQQFADGAKNALAAGDFYDCSCWPTLAQVLACSFRDDLECRSRFRFSSRSSSQTSRRTF